MPSFIKAALLMFVSVFQVYGVSATIYSIEVKAPNYFTAIEQANQQLMNDLIKTAQTKGSIHHQPLNLTHVLILPIKPTPRLLGRRVKEQLVKVQLELSEYDIIDMLELLITQAEIEMTNMSASSQGDWIYLQQILYTIQTLLYQPMGVEIRSAYELHQRFSKALQQLDQTTYLAKIDFVGELHQATLWLDGEEHQQHSIKVAPGEHIFEFIRDGYLSVNGSIRLAPGEQRRLLIRMTKVPNKLIPINVKLDKSLQNFEQSVQSNLSSLGFIHDPKQSKVTFHFQLSHSSAEVNKSVGLDQLILNYALSIKLIDESNSEFLLVETWHQNQSIAITDEFHSQTGNRALFEVTNSKSYHFVQDMLRQAMYDMNAHINRQALLKRYEQMQ